MLQKRCALEENNELDARVSALEEDLDDMEMSDEEETDFARVSWKSSNQTRRRWRKSSNSIFYIHLQESLIDSRSHNNNIWISTVEAFRQPSHLRSK